MSTPAVSVLLSVRNGARYLRQAVESVLTQSLGCFELLVRDDGSQDESGRMIQDYRGDARVRIIAGTERLGLYGSMNRLALEAKAPLLKFFCQDDLLVTDCLRELDLYFTGGGYLGYFYTGSLSVDESGHGGEKGPVDLTPVTLTGIQADFMSYVYGCLSANLSCLQVPSQVFKALGGFREGMVSGDFDLMVRIQNAHCVGRIDKGLVLVRRHSEQWSRSPDSGLLSFLENARIYAELKERLVSACVLTGPEADDILALKYGWNGFHRVLSYAVHADMSRARKMYQALAATGYLARSFQAWISTLPDRFTGRKAPYRRYEQIMKRSFPC